MNKQLMKPPIPSFKVKPTEALDARLLMRQLPETIRKRLGIIEETGFHLGLNRRDIYCQNGTVSYILNSDSMTVNFD